LWLLGLLAIGLALVAGSILGSACIVAVGPSLTDRLVLLTLLLRPILAGVELYSERTYFGCLA
jgi:multisubunit Na+/H+ antiporter MnhF subunit